MKRCFKIHFAKKHLLIHDGNNVILIDTGSPQTIHTSRTLEFLGKQYGVTTNAMGSTIANLKEMAGIEFTTLMGLDILSEYDIILDYANEEITFCSIDEPMPSGISYNFNSMLPMISIPVTVAGQSRQLIVDTGATTSYINSATTRGMTPAATITDFSPLLGGQFSTPVFNLESTFLGKTFICTFGNLPAAMEGMINLLGAEGVIGYDLLKSCKLLISCSRNQITLLN